jgi:hypothetical protein
MFENIIMFIIGAVFLLSIFGPILLIGKMF